MAKSLARFYLVLLVLCLVFLVAAVGQQQNRPGSAGGVRKKGQLQIQHPNAPANGRPRPGQQPNRMKPANPNGVNIKTGKKQRVVMKTIPALGQIRGRVIKSEWSGRDIMQFHDIPYGKSPAGVMRFKAAEPADAWKGVLNAAKPHIGCPSLQNLEVFDELEQKQIDVNDCLRLTISSKNLNGKRSPIMVYIHGDFLYDGSTSEAAPGYLLEEDIVLVAVRYRLGPFGFLSTLTEDIPGNAAVNDVILALRWIQDYIEHFGGDPKRVTLFGQVGGAALINVLTMSPAVSYGLFHRVIYQSATALTPAFITDSPIASARDIARHAGCKNVNKVEAINRCMHRLNTTALLTAFNAHGDAKAAMGFGHYGGVQFVIGGPSGILPAHPGELLAVEKFKPYPTIAGTVKNAGTFILKDIYIDNFNETIIDDKLDGIGYIDHIIAQTNGIDPTGAWKKYAQEEIFKTAELKNGSFYRMAPGLIDMCSVISFKNPVLLTMQANAKKLPNSTFLYSFDYEGDFNRYTTNEDDEGSTPFELGVSLTDDNLFLFPWPRFSTLNTLRDIKIAKRMVAYWTSFAANGVPVADNVPDWPAMTDDTGPYMKIGKIVTIGDNYLDEYTIAVKEANAGYNLINDEFFESLIEIDAYDKISDSEGDDGDDDDEGNKGINRGRGTSIVVIAKRNRN